MTSPRRIPFVAGLALLAIALAGCAAPKPPAAVREFASRVVALNQPTSFGSTTNLDGRHLLTARHVLPMALQRSDTVRVGSRTFDLTRGIYRGKLQGQTVALLVPGIGRPRHAIRTDWAVLAPHPPTLPAVELPRFAPPPTVGARVWVIGFPEAMGGTEPDAKPTILAATVMAPMVSVTRGLDADTDASIDLAGSFAARFEGSPPDLAGMSGGPVLWVAPDGTARVVGVASQQASRDDLLGLTTRRSVFVCPVPENLGQILAAPLPEPVNLPTLRGPAGPEASDGSAP